MGGLLACPTREKFLNPLLAKLLVLEFDENFTEGVHANVVYTVSRRYGRVSRAVRDDLIAVHSTVNVHRLC